jgi:hypothetical protein
LSAEVERELNLTFHPNVEDMIKICDVVTINCPLHPETENLFDEAMIGRMKRGAYLVNTARGKICNRDAVARALESGQLAGYAGDVWFPQPAPRDHPWRTMPHHGMTPHTSGSSLSAQARYAAGTREILECWFDGRPIREERSHRLTAEPDAPPRVEMAEMITSRDIDKILSLLRRVYGAIVIDMSSALNDINLAFLDLSDTIVEIVTYDSTTIRNTMAVADAFRMIGYPASKVRYLVNRADSPGGIDPVDLERALGRVPEHRVVSDGMLVVQSNNEGVPFVLANPSAPISQDLHRIAAELMAAHGLVRAAAAGRR